MCHLTRENSKKRTLSADSTRYIFNPRVDGSIDKKEATLSLARCCIWYLLQSHFDPWITENDVADSIISGNYRLHNFAVNMWLELVKCYVGLNESKPPSTELISALECLTIERSNSDFSGSTELAGQSHQPQLEKFKDEWPELHTMLCHVAQFRWRCSSSDYHMSKGEMS